MAQVIITINYREYPISCDNGQEIQIMKLGRLLDEKAKSLTSALGHINENQLLAMVGLLLADELSELKKTVSSAPAPAASLPHAATPPALRHLRHQHPHHRLPRQQRQSRTLIPPYQKKNYLLLTLNWRKI